MNNEELAVALLAVKNELSNASSAYSLNHYIDRASEIIRKFDIPESHSTKSYNKDFDIRHDAIQNLHYTLSREGGWAKSAGSGVLKSVKKRNEAQGFLNKAISQLQWDIDSFLSAVKR